MVQSGAATPEEYIAELPEKRREVVQAVRRTILANLQPGYEEGMLYGMLGYYVPLERHPVTDNGQALSYVALAGQKRHVSLYMMAMHDREEAAFRAEWEATGRKLDMGRSCVRFTRLDAVPLDVVGRWVARESVEEYIARYEASRR